MIVWVCECVKVGFLSVMRANSLLLGMVNTLVALMCCGMCLAGCDVT